MEDNASPEPAQDATRRSVSIDWSKYQLPPFRGADTSDAPASSGPVADAPSSQRAEHGLSYSPLSQHVRQDSPQPDAGTDDDNDASSIPSIADLRENRFLGSAKNWRDYTRAERNVVKALETERARDLSAHLYNAFALQKRAALAREARRGGKGKGKAVGSPALGEVEDDEEDDEEPFDPGQQWTAWPMAANEVPRVGEDEERDADDMFTLRAQPDGRPSAVLEECLMARMLKVAKEKWEAREWEDGIVEGDLGGAEEEQTRERRGIATGSDASDTQYTASTHGATTDASDVSASESEAEGSHTSGEEILRPVIQTDDEKSYRLLRPDARHILTRLDDLLLALHRARMSYMELAYDRDPRIKRKRRRRKTTTEEGAEDDFEDGEAADAGQDGGADEAAEEATLNKPALRRRKRRIRARSAQNKNLAMEGEDRRFASDSEREFTPSSSSSSSESEPESDSSPHQHNHGDGHGPDADGEVPAEQEAELNSHYSLQERTVIRSHPDRIGLRDWSDVLGMAALTGFPIDVVQRASARCAELFGEDMAFRTFEPGRMRKVPATQAREQSDEGESAEGEETAPTWEYTEEPPDMAEMGAWKWRRQQMSKRRQKRDGRSGATTGSTAGTQSGSGTHLIVKKAPERKLLCPVANCRRAQPGNGFSRVWNLNQHTTRMHPDLQPAKSSRKRPAETPLGIDAPE